MGVRFIVGRAGSGKTRFCFEQIVGAMRAQPLGTPIYLIVPKQETFSAERELTCGSGLAGFCRTRVVSFEMLGEQVLSECGGLAIPQVTELGRQMMLGHLLRKHEKELGYYGSSARRTGLAAALDETFAELERSGRAAVDLENVLVDLKHKPDDPALFEKLSDLRLLYSKYLGYLGNERLDPQRRLEQVLLGLERCRLIRGAKVYVDGFLDLFDWQRRMLVGLGRICDTMEITILMDSQSRVLKDPHHLPDELGLFYKTEQTYRQLWFAFSEAGIPIEPHQPLKEIERFISPSLRQVEQHGFAARRVKCAEVEGIKLIEAPDRRAEVDSAAREVLGLVDKGMRLREIAVLARDLTDYHELIDASFREHGIPSFADRRRLAAHHPLLQFTRAVLHVSMSNWPRDAVMALLKSELAGISRDEADELENYVLEHRIAGGAVWMDPRPWEFVRKMTRRRAAREEEEEPSPEELDRTARVDALRRRITEPMADLVGLFGTHQALSARAIATELFHTFDRFGVRQLLSQWIEECTNAGRLEERDEHQQVWSELTALLDQMVDVLGDEPLYPEDFVNVLETGLEQFDFALTPPTVDQVLVGAVDRTRTPRARAVILLGMNDLQFPRVLPEDPILADSERQVLRSHRLPIEPGSQRSLLDERLFGYIALTRASEQLILTRSIADSENRPQAPSPFWVHLRQQFPSLIPEPISRQSSSLREIGTPRQLVTGVMHWARGSPAGEGWPNIYQWLSTRKAVDDPVGRMIKAAWPALTYENRPDLSAAIVGKLFRSPLRTSVSQIESFASCAFKHFAQYGLRLAPRDEEDVTVMELGIVCHGILERIVREMFADQQDWAAHTSSDQVKMIARVAEEVGREIRGELLLTGGHNQYILGHIRKTMQQVLDSQSAAGKRGRFVPWRMELEFGDSTDLGPYVLPTPAGNQLRLKGKIDRVDKARNAFEFAVIDYKYSGDKLSLYRVLHGLSLQLLTYLLVLRDNGSKLLKREFTPVAALYVQVLRTLESVKHPDEAEVPVGIEGHKRYKPRGIIDASKADRLDIELSGKGSMGELYSRTDARSAEEFNALLQLAQTKLAEMGDLIIKGVIDVAPYRIGTESPCSRCDFRSVCRFDPGINMYRRLPVVKTDEVLRIAMEGTK